MTCIVGLEDVGSVWIGGDSSGVAEYDMVLRSDPKVFRLIDNDKAVIGYTSSFRMGQLMMYKKGLIPKKSEYKNSHHHMVEGFVPEVRKLFSNGGYMATSENREVGGTFLLGYEGKLWHIDSDFQVGRSLFGYDSVGCGASYALGSLYTTEKLHMRPQLRVLEALRAANKFSAGVAPPYIIMNTLTKEVFTYEE